MWKNIIEPDRPQRIACWIPKSTNTFSEYVILISFPLNYGCMNAPQCYIQRLLPVLFSFSASRINISFVLFHLQSDIKDLSSHLEVLLGHGCLLICTSISFPFDILRTVHCEIFVKVKPKTYATSQLYFWYPALYVSDRLTVHHQESWYCIHSKWYLSCSFFSFG